MKINKDYLKEFCKYHHIFSNKRITEEKLGKLNYNFGVPLPQLTRIKNFEDLEKTINKYVNFSTFADDELKQEVLITYNSF